MQRTCCKLALQQGSDLFFTATTKTKSYNYLISPPVSELAVKYSRNFLVVLILKKPKIKQILFHSQATFLDIDILNVIKWQLYN